MSFRMASRNPTELSLPILYGWWESKIKDKIYGYVHILSWFNAGWC